MLLHVREWWENQGWLFIAPRIPKLMRLLVTCGWLQLKGIGSSISCLCFSCILRPCRRNQVLPNYLGLSYLILGRATQCFFGSSKKCYKNYVKYCYGQKPRPLDTQVFQTPRVFHRERKLRHITLEKAYVCFWGFEYDLTSRDQYSSEKYIRLVKLEEEHRDLEAKERKSAKDKLELKKLEKKIQPLKSFLDDAASHRKAIKAEIGIFHFFHFFFVVF